MASCRSGSARPRSPHGGGRQNVLVAGTGYTGEDGVELLLAPEHATKVWDALIEQGATPIGLGARDTLRLEVCFHLYGNDLSEERGPIEAGLGLVLQGGHGLHRLGRRSARSARTAPPSGSFPSS